MQELYKFPAMQEIVDELSTLLVAEHLNSFESIVKIYLGVFNEEIALF